MKNLPLRADQATSVSIGKRVDVSLDRVFADVIAAVSFAFPHLDPSEVHREVIARAKLWIERQDVTGFDDEEDFAELARGTPTNGTPVQGDGEQGR